jgi:hypothetical protein
VRNLYIIVSDMKVINVTKNTVVADQLTIATSLRARSKGLLGRRSLSAAEGLLLKPCNAIHMFFMHFALDVVFLSPEGIVLRTIRGIKPWRLSPLVFGAQQALELPIGTIVKAGIESGDFLLLVP